MILFLQIPFAISFMFPLQYNAISPSPRRGGQTACTVKSQFVLGINHARPPDINCRGRQSVGAERHQASVPARRCRGDVARAHFIGRLATERSREHITEHACRDNVTGCARVDSRKCTTKHERAYYAEHNWNELRVTIG